MMADLKWHGPIAAWEIGPHYNGWLKSKRLARVFECRTLEGLAVLPHPNGRARRLYLALVRPDGRGHVLGVYRSLRKAKAECEKWCAREGME